MKLFFFHTIIVLKHNRVYFVYIQILTVINFSIEVDGNCDNIYETKKHHLRFYSVHIYFSTVVDFCFMWHNIFLLKLLLDKDKVDVIKRILHFHMVVGSCYSSNRRTQIWVIGSYFWLLIYPPFFLWMAPLQTQIKMIKVRYFKQSFWNNFWYKKTSFTSVFFNTFNDFCFDLKSYQI